MEIKEISLTFKNSQITGFLLQEKENEYVVKLSSGYQIQLLKKNCSNVKIDSSSLDLKSSSISKEIKKNSKLPNIAIFHTGGTIASKVDYATGAVSSHFTPEELISQFEELNTKANLQAFMIGNLMSEDLRFGHYNKMLNAIKEHASSFDGIIISHGTDTMHYTSSALHYGLENLNIPVLLIGAQRSSDRASSDAFSNLEAGIEFISYNKKLREENKPSFNRVGICMHKTIDDNEFLILDGINAKKMHSSRRDAFKQINFKPVCTITSTFNIVDIRKELFTISNSSKQLEITMYNENLKIGFFTAHPHLHKEEIEALSLYDGVILSGTGLGHIGLSEFDEISKQNLENYDAIKKIAYKIPVCVGVQSVYGKVNINVYSSGIRLLEAGVLGNFSALTIETQFIKLAHLLSKNSNSNSNSKITNEVWASNLEGFNTQKLVDNEE
ncbi:MAG: Glu-tRNA(Gln) amidotransferase subunit GatD [Nanoarchaeota archaeon]|nr:Glu-tRNA(Gln) amidotransferase subunit GatD [Nanoarchaeota archaeon]